MDPIQKLLPLRPADYQILLALVDQQAHAYRIAREIEERTDGLIRLEAGNLHRSLQKLQRQALIAEVADVEQADHRARRFYSLTEFGRRVLAAEARRLRDVVSDAIERRLIADER